jgi:hypothetical protein
VLIVLKVLEFPLVLQELQVLQELVLQALQELVLQVVQELVLQVVQELVLQEHQMAAVINNKTVIKLNLQRYQHLPIRTLLRKKNYVFIICD